ncbi:MAG: hypothetical protein BGN92_11035 [Sphingobacteriales bacterium 41-5]|nr:MAG: hypothetical protein BGN92_11035 [Sphingobacteriales bacterium 41-5]
MKLIILSLAATLLYSTQTFSQSRFGSVVEKYYRVNPFEGSFPAFVKSLSSDPELLDKTLIPKSDSSNYFLKGTYEVFNPFSINAEKVEMLFAEHQQEIQEQNVSTLYTVYTYQILAYFDDTDLNRKMVLKDYNAIKKNLKKEMAVEIGSLKGFKNVEDGEISNYYFSNSFISPLTLSWQTLSQSKKLALTMITKLAVNRNYAIPGGTSIPSGPL